MTSDTETINMPSLGKRVHYPVSEGPFLATRTMHSRLCDTAVTRAEHCCRQLTANARTKHEREIEMVACLYTNTLRRQSEACLKWPSYTYTCKHWRNVQNVWMNNAQSNSAQTTPLHMGVSNDCASLKFAKSYVQL